MAQATEQEKKTISILTHLTQGQGETTTLYFQKAMEDAKLKFPDCDLNQEVIDVEAYKSKIKAKTAANELPDIFLSWGAGYSQNLVKSGKLLDLSDYMTEAYTSQMIQGENQAFEFDNGVYGITTTKWAGALFCNTKLFEQYGLELPETFEELLAVCRVFRENGITPISLGLKSLWAGQEYIDAIALQIEGAERYREIASGKAGFDEGSLKEAADYVLQMVQEECFNEDMFQIDVPEQRQRFKNGKCAMTYCTSVVTAYFAEEAKRGEIAAIRFPLVKECQYPRDYHGGAIDGFSVNAHTAYPETCTEIVEYLTMRMAYYSGEMTTWKIPAEDRKTDDWLKQQIVEWTSDAEDWGLAYDTLLPFEASDIWLKEIGKLFKKEIDGEEFVDNLTMKLW